MSALTFVGVGIAVPLLDSSPVAAALLLPAAVLVAGVMASVWHGVAYAELAAVAGIQRAGTALAMGNTGVFLVLFATPVAATAAVGHWGWGMFWGLCGVCALVAAALFPAVSGRSRTVAATP